MSEQEPQSIMTDIDINDLSQQSFEDLLHVAMAASNDVNLDVVVKVCNEMAARFPDRAEQYFILGVAALRLDDEGQAIAYFERAHDMDPDCREYTEALSNICMRAGRLADGTFYAKLAVAGTSHPLLGRYMPSKLTNLAESMAAVRPSTHFLEASRLYNLRNLPQALRECSAEIRLNADHFEAYVLLGRIYLETKKYGKALGAFQAAAQLAPDDNTVQGLVARTLAHLGRHSEAGAIANRVMRTALRDLEPEAHGAALDAMLLNPAVDREQIISAADRFEAAFYDDNPAPEDRESIGKSRDVPRVGLYSNSYFRSILASRFIPWFQARVKKAHWLGYQQSVHEDLFTTILKRGTEEWREIFDLDPYTLSYTLAGEALNVLVDLCGLDGESRFALAALRPTDVRVGTFALTEPGLAPGITHILSDSVLVKGDEAWMRDGQVPVAISRSLFARAPFGFEADESPAPATENGYVTFGGVIEPYRLSPETACLWAEILLAVPNSKLLLIRAEEYGPEVRDRARELFAALGVAGRIVFTLGEDDVSETDNEEGVDDDAPAIRPDTIVPPVYWTGVDVFLDTSPINCIEECHEALWSGVPVVTLAGSRRPARVGASILTAAKRDAWIAESDTDFVSKACALVADLTELGAARSALLGEIRSSALFDAEGSSAEVIEVLARLAHTHFADHRGEA